MPRVRPSRSLLSGWLALWCLAGLLFATPAAAQTGSVTGAVTHSATGLPIAGVQIGVYTLNTTFVGDAVTNGSGVYTVTNVPPGLSISSTRAATRAGIS